MTKTSRHNTILHLVEQERPANQEDLRKALVRKGCKVTQATLSRDIRELGLVKGPDGYQFPSGDAMLAVIEQVLPAPERLMREFALSVKAAQNLVVIKTAA